MILIGIIYRTQYKIRNKISNAFTVDSIKQETSDTYTLNLKSKKPFDFKAGQFCFLRINKNRLYARHPFTVSSAPNDNVTSFTIKHAGRFTETARTLKTGEKISVEGPFGVFIPKPDKDLVFIAGGVGITPFMSILKDRINNNSNQNITLIYCSRGKDDIIFKNEIDSINKSWFKKIYVLNSTDGALFPCEQGYISNKIIEKYVNNIQNSLYYICGPEKMKNSAKKILGDLKVDKSSIFTEDFFW
jgi:predicted ferric reductase